MPRLYRQPEASINARAETGRVAQTPATSVPRRMSANAVNTFGMRTSCANGNSRRRSGVGAGSVDGEAKAAPDLDEALAGRAGGRVRVLDVRVQLHRHPPLVADVLHRCQHGREVDGPV